MRKRNSRFLAALLTLFALAGCAPGAPLTDAGSVPASQPLTHAATKGGTASATDEGILGRPFEETLSKAQGKTVTFYGWGGSEGTNAYLDGYLKDVMREKYGIILKRVGMNIDEILSTLMNERQLNTNGSMDVIWINGENFVTALDNGLLYGPISGRLPNFNQYVDSASPDVRYDFGIETQGYEVPFGKAQLVMIYDKAKTASPPYGHQALLAWAKENPGRFTYPAPPDFTGSAFIRNIICDIVGAQQFLTMEADYDTVKEAVGPAMAYLKELKPYLWNEGKTYPAQLPLLDHMFQDGEVDFTMDYNPNSASARAQSGEFPSSVGTFVFEKGSIGNTHFVSIPFNAPNPDGAMILINEILSVEAQAKKYDPAGWGDLPVLDNSRLSAGERSILAQVPLGQATLPQDVLSARRIPEMPAKLVPIIEQIWLETVPGE